ncbi:MAG TPA: 4-(cytidine 5'-diphospho)-2-C-methyl-D-erythritol kinase [Candidatus Eremiobacteraeota bacterium]|nr:MAG: 4-diphosphocytidyl-2-C-methyl-D-erythritol kinase [bacterium ADurb.Bin363]HPZ07109.1 4-(cytidine 5'-diphospho)-2-C-methyl-D-erythritol kinase [Candidatus Eremiobacteraeota bacterium]
MLSLVEKAYAKVNFFLEIMRKRPDGYHEIRTIFQAISLADELIFYKSQNEISLVCQGADLSCKEDNIVYRAAQLVKNKTGCNKGVSIILNKKIPLAAGLGGGSSDAAATLRGLNKLWQLNLTLPELLELGGNLGSDVPFFIVGGTVYAEGRGEKLVSFLPTPDFLVVILKPEIFISTEWAYKQWDSEKIRMEKPEIEGFVENLKKSVPFLGRNFLFNSFESIVENNYAEIKTIKEILRKMEIRDYLLSGSGSSVFSLTEDLKLAEEIRDNIEKNHKDIQCFITRTIKSYDL